METKTITMPLSEYERMREELANIRFVEELNSSEKEKYEKEIENLNSSIKFRDESFANLVFEKWDLEAENKELKQEIERLKQRKWWQIWKK